MPKQSSIIEDIKTLFNKDNIGFLLEIIEKVKDPDENTLNKILNDLNLKNMKKKLKNVEDYVNDLKGKYGLDKIVDFFNSRSPNRPTSRRSKRSAKSPNRPTSRRSKRSAKSPNRPTSRRSNREELSAYEGGAIIMHSSPSGNPLIDTLCIIISLCGLLFIVLDMLSVSASPVFTFTGPALNVPIRICECIGHVFATLIDYIELVTSAVRIHNSVIEELPIAHNLGMVVVSSNAIPLSSNIFPDNIETPEMRELTRLRRLVPDLQLIIDTTPEEVNRLQNEIDELNRELQTLRHNRGLNQFFNSYNQRIRQITGEINRRRHGIEDVNSSLVRAQAQIEYISSLDRRVEEIVQDVDRGIPVVESTFLTEIRPRDVHVDERIINQDRLDIVMFIKLYGLFRTILNLIPQSRNRGGSRIAIRNKSNRRVTKKNIKNVNLY